MIWGIYHNFTTITEILSMEPWTRAIFINVFAITSGSSCYLRIFCMLFGFTKSQIPSLATITKRWFSLISTFFTSGLAIRPIFFLSARSPNALVIAKRPPNLPIRIFPPALVIITVLLWPLILMLGCHSDAMGSIFRNYYHRTGKLRNLQHEQRKVLFSLILELTGKQFQLNLLQDQVQESSYLPWYKAYYDVKGLLE